MLPELHRNLTSGLSVAALMYRNIQNTIEIGCVKVCSDIQISVRDPENMGFTIEDNHFVTAIQRKEN